MGIIFKGFIRLVRTCVIAAALLLLLAIWQAGRDLPQPAVHWMEKRLCRGSSLCIRFERASISLRYGLRLHNLRIFEKRRLGPPAMTIAEARIFGHPRRDKPPLAWIESIHLSQLIVDELPAIGTTAQTNLAQTAQQEQSLGAKLQKQFPAHPIRIDADNVLFWGARAEQISALCRLEGPRLRLDNIRIELPARNWREQFDGWLEVDLRDGRLQANADGVLTPEAIAPLFLHLDGEHALEICRRFGGYTSPLRLNGELIRAAQPSDGGRVPIEAHLKIEGNKLHYRKIPIRRLRSEMTWRNDGKQRFLAFAPLYVESEHGLLEGTLTHYPATHLMELNLRSTLDIEEAAQSIGLTTTNLPFAVKSDIPPIVTLHGRWAEEEAQEESLLQGGLLFNGLSFDNYHFNRFSGDLVVRGSNSFEFSNIAATCYDGSITGELALVQSEEAISNLFVTASLAITGLDIASLRGDAGVTNESRGTLSGHLKLEGDYSNERLNIRQGEGKLAIRKGMLMRVPLFAGLTDFLARNVPGVDSIVTQSDSSIDFAVSNGIMRVEQLLVEGGLCSIRASGTCRLLEREFPVNGTAQVRLFKQGSVAGMVARIVTFPINKLLEFRVEGSLYQPGWNYIGLIDRLRDLTRGRDDEAGEAE